MKKIVVAVCLFLIMICSLSAQSKALSDFGIKMIEVPEKNACMSETEITNHTYSLVMGNHKDDMYPVSDVTWQEAVVFCNKLSELMGLKPVYSYNGKTDIFYVAPGDTKDIKEDASADGFKLPSMSLWDCAAAAGKLSSYLYKSDVDKFSWNKENSDGKPHPVAQKAPNAWGFYDMKGNVSEWVFDGKNSGNVVVRYYMGGNYDKWSNYHNESHPPIGAGMRQSWIGFRICQNKK